MRHASGSTASSYREIVMSAEALLARLRAEQGNHLRPAVGPATRNSPSSRSALQTLESSGKGDGAQIDFPLQVSAAPILQEREQDFAQLGLAKELWIRILKDVGDHDLRRCMQACRGFYHHGWNLNSVAPDPNSEQGRQQRDICSKRLDKILDNTEYTNYTDKIPAAQDVKAFGQELQTLASRYRCLQVRVEPGFEEAVCTALVATPRWQSLALYFFKMPPVDCDRTMIHRLEQGLAKQGRKADLFLNLGVGNTGGVLACDTGWMKTFTAGSALRLTGLCVKEYDYSHFIELKQYLESDNSLDFLEAHSAAALLPSLQKGSRRLTKMVIADHALYDKPAALLQTLESKEQLTRLGFQCPTFAASGLTLPAVLKAAKKLEVLHLTFGSIKPGASAGTEQALKDSRLREISFNNFTLHVIRIADEVELEHAELFNGMRQARHLTTLHLSFGMNQIGNGAFLSAFADNPHAQKLSVDPKEAGQWKAPLASANARRIARQWDPIVLQEGRLSIQSN